MVRALGLVVEYYVWTGSRLEEVANPQDARRALLGININGRAWNDGSPLNNVADKGLWSYTAPQVFIQPRRIILYEPAVHLTLGYQLTP
ncbi:hypothetical protein GJ744_001768 [Endocarpon pusillum]|uniref:Uncharacterized protein n=1 Tax=Endocarpon pusillum TaxID=364733 RepID=A0A8H7ABN8_9EURO|nr:hypothetical protein GJ744_001768 [Endocarpon pusillum]